MTSSNRRLLLPSELGEIVGKLLGNGVGVLLGAGLGTDVGDGVGRRVGVDEIVGLIVGVTTSVKYLRSNPVFWRFEHPPDNF